MDEKDKVKFDELVEKIETIQDTTAQLKRIADAQEKIAYVLENITFEINHNKRVGDKKDLVLRVS